jgi:pyrimidine-specific ribonucleoside hydrolase
MAGAATPRLSDNEGELETLEGAEAARRELATHSELFEDFGLGPHAEQLGRSGPFPDTLVHTPLIVDTDIGGDPDDAVAVALAARSVRELALVVTSDERDGERARFARHFLDLLGLPEVPVVAGRQLSDTRYFCVEGVVPAAVPPQRSDVSEAVRAVLQATEGPVRWLGLGPASNLADVLVAHPDLAERFAVTQMGGAIHYRRADRAEHNFRLDPAAIGTVFQAVTDPFLVISDVTFKPEIEISASARMYRWLGARDAPLWARLLKVNFDRWFEQFHPGSRMHDPLTLTAALELPYLDFGRKHVTVRSNGWMSVDEQGAPIFVSHSADYAAFMRWVEAGLGVVDS